MASSYSIFANIGYDRAHRQRENGGKVRTGVALRADDQLAAAPRRIGVCCIAACVVGNYVVFHALFLTFLSLRPFGGFILPPYVYYKAYSKVFFVECGKTAKSCLEMMGNIRRRTSMQYHGYAAF